ncbi:MAG: BTAD domain-containing putative transcriptional regulator [Actinomycetales bacterium]
MLDISVLGRLTVTMDGHPVVPSAGKQRQVLALLALRAGQVVPASALMEEIWGERPPRSASTTLQTYVLKLRRLLDVASPGIARRILVTCYGGYRLVLDDGRIDAREFEHLVADGDALYESGDDLGAAARYREAQQLCRGPALVDVPCGPLLQLETLRLEETCRVVLERRLAIEVSVGRHRSALPELRALVAEHPQHEGFSLLLMLALHRSGGAALALREYQRLRTTLVEEVGIEPSAAVRSLHRAVLTGALDGGEGLGAVRTHGSPR